MPNHNVCIRVVNVPQSTCNVEEEEEKLGNE